MNKKTLDDLADLRGKKVLIRVDFNVTHDAAGNITNDRRIRAALPTIRHVLDADGCAIVMSHFGRPSGDPAKDAIFRMDRIGQRLSELLGRPVRKIDAVIGPPVTSAVQALRPGEVLLLENLRFHKGEKKGDPAFAAELAALGDVYVNDAFGSCHNEDASMLALPRAMAGKPRVLGRLVVKELAVLDRLLAEPRRPLVGIMGGAKVSDKIAFIDRLLARVDRLLVGGAMTYTFLKAQGNKIGCSRCEDDQLETARRLLAAGKIVLPVDHLVADRPEAGARTQVVTDIPDGWYGMDIGPGTIESYRAEIGRAGTVVWNGPMGKFEDEPFAQGTEAIARALADSQAETIVGGGETAEAVEELGLAEQMTHVSTGGGAFLKYVETGNLVALGPIEDKL